MHGGILGFFGGGFVFPTKSLLEVVIEFRSGFFVQTIVNKSA
jgi:hypothetical protein